MAMSQSDKDEMKRLAPHLSVEIVPNGIDSSFFKKVTLQERKGSKILFVGNFSWLQNREAVFFLISEVWPFIKSKIKGARLWVVGRNPTKKIRELAQDDGIVIDDKVTDIREAYSESDLLLAPIFGPGGTRFKILEAMASNLPVVTTPTGIEGIPAEIGKEVLIGESPQELVEAAVRILKDKNLGEKLAQNARILVEKQFDWGIISQKLDRVYQNVAQKIN